MSSIGSCPLHPTTMVRWTLSGLAVLSLLGTAACGASSSSPSSASTAPSSSATPRGQAMQAYRQCLTQHGVTFPARHQSGGATPSTTPQPGTPPPGVNPQTWSAARTACTSLAPHRTPASSTAGS
jgi:hypothetical protein